jgi:hypothetical protein
MKEKRKCSHGVCILAIFARPVDAGLVEHATLGGKATRWCAVAVSCQVVMEKYLQD